jgi:hypothetical protein
MTGHIAYVEVATRMKGWSFSIHINYTHTRPVWATSNRAVPTWWLHDLLQGFASYSNCWNRKHSLSSASKKQDCEGDLAKLRTTYLVSWHPHNNLTLSHTSVVRDVTVNVDGSMPAG